MKRLTYISRLSQSIPDDQIDAIGAISSRNNAQQGITGVLIYFSGLFFQMIEGDEEKIDNLYGKILQDPRHTDILCLKSEYEVTERLFPDWSMNTINLDKNADALARPVKILLQTLTESHGVIEQYTQPAVLKIINKGLNPITVPPRKTEKVILFGDIVSFSTLSENLPVEQTAEMINRYLDIASAAITAQGGEVTKFIGDCIMAYFDPEQTDAALQACLNILEELEQTRQSATTDSPMRLLHCGLGLARGVVIEGNLGGATKKDYTILGDAVNTAARLESLTRSVKRALVFSESVKNGARETWDFVALGAHDLKGKEKMTEIYSLDHNLANDFDVKEKIAEAAKRLGAG